MDYIEIEMKPITELNLPQGYQFKDENGKIINATKIVLEKKKKEYPKTFLGCCDVLGIEDTISRGVKGYKAELFDTLQKLYICRDAYWKIAGEEKGLGKPWEPDSFHQVFSIGRISGTLIGKALRHNGKLLFWNFQPKKCEMLSMRILRS